MPVDTNVEDPLRKDNYYSYLMKQPGWGIVLAGSISLVVSLLLAFRTDTAYSEYIDDNSDKQRKAKNMKLLLAFAIAIKHHLRSEPGTHWPDLEDLIPEEFQK
ncbi:41053_t:CDS:2, partial [Gigaspora margarita]